ncbi:MAG: ParB/RepB/Spo0J family partition protein [Carbonactinosporaceae bacterium]
MTERRRGLGRGLGALIPPAPPRDGTSSGVAPGVTPTHRAPAATGLGVVGPPPNGRTTESSHETMAGPGSDAVAVAGAIFAEIPLDAVSPNPRQPREVFDEDALAELAHSIKEVGLLQPVVVRETVPGRYELVMGERRWRAARHAGLDLLPAIVRSTDDNELLLNALLENLHRSELNPLEEAAAYDQLLKDFSCTHEALAERVGRSRSQVTNTLRLLRLPPAVQRRVAAGVLSAGHARALIAMSDPEEQERLAHRIVAEGLSVRVVEEVVTLDEQSTPPRRPRAGKRVSSAITDLAVRLSDRFETRVKVDLGQRKGKIVVEFGSVEDLERIMEMMAPGEHIGLGRQHGAVEGTAPGWDEDERTKR